MGSLPVPINLQLKMVMGTEYAVAMEMVDTQLRLMIKKLHLEENLIVKKQKHLMLHRLLLLHLQPLHLKPPRILPRILFQLRIQPRLAKVKVNHVKSLKTVVKEVVRKKERREYANRLLFANPQVAHVRKMRTVVLGSVVVKKV